MSKVLILHNNKARLKKLHHAFVSLGYEVLFARDGAYGEELFFEEEPDCVIADILISGKPGTDLALAIKTSKIGQFTPFILTIPQFKRIQLDETTKAKWKIDGIFNDPYDISDLVNKTIELIDKYAKWASKADVSKEPEEISTGEQDQEIGIDLEAEKETEKTADVIKLPLARESRVKEEIEPGPEIPIPEETKTISLDKARRHPDSDIKPAGADDVGDALAQAAKEAAMDFEALGAPGKQSKPKPKAAPTFKKSQEPQPQEPQSSKETPPPRLETLAIPKPIRSEENSIITLGILDKVPQKGSLEKFSIPELIANIFIRDLSGIINVENDAGIKKSIYFKRGVPIYVRGQTRDETLGRVLVKNGIISEETAYQSLQNMAGNKKKKQGGVLLEMGALTPVQLYQGLKLQIRTKALSSFSWTTGSFEFIPGPVDTSALTVFELEPVQLIVDGLNQNFRPELIRTVLKHTKGANIRVRWSEIEITRYALTQDAISVFGLIDGKKSVSNIISQSGLDKIQAGIVLYVLWLLGAYEKVEEKNGAQKPEAKPEPEKVKAGRLANVDRATEGLNGSMFLEPGQVDDFLDNLPDDELSDIPLGANEPDRGFADIEEGDFREIAVPEPAEEIEDEAKKELPLIEESPPTLEERAAKKISNNVTADDVTDLDMAFRNLENQLDERKRVHDEEGADPFVMKSSKSNKKKGNLEEQPSSEMSPVDKRLLDEILTDYLALENANYYQIMRLDQRTTDSQIKDKYREIVKKLHSDKLRDRFEKEVIEKANSLVARVTEAYTTLGDPKRRREYDRLLTPDGVETRERHISHILIAEHEFSLGTAAANRGDWENAKAHFQLAVEGFPEEAAYHTELAWAIYNSQLGSMSDRATRATRFLERAIKINPKDDKPYYYLGSILRDNGYVDKAAKMFAQSFRFNRKNTKAQNALRALLREKEEERKRAVLARRKRKRKETEGSISGLLKKDFDIFSIFRKKD